jgi:hypothetical protein
VLGTAAGLTAVDGCPGLKALSGTLEQVSAPPKQHGRPGGSPARIGLADGIVSDAGASGFTVTTPAGFHVRVTTSAQTAVYQLHSASLPALRTGAFTAAAGSAGPGGTLSATAVDQGANLPHAGSGRPHNPHLPGPAAPGCSSLAVATALLTAS